MWARIIAAALVLSLCLTFCLIAGQQVFGVVDEARGLCREAEVLAEAAQYADAKKALERIETVWGEKQGFFEALLPHEDLHEVTNRQIEATANLELMDLDDFYLSMELLDEELSHLREHETLAWSNLL